ncbi:MAG TPA: hypothetical protein VGL56_04920 [Fimbriimonadaceae bacterium]|jgi:hypothetical protein
MVAAALFLIWFGYGIWQWRRAPQLLIRLKQIRPAYRKLNGTLLLVGSAALLLGGLITLFSSAEKQTQLTFWQWLCVAVIGSIFVYCQTMAAAMLVSLGDFAVTGADDSASSSADRRNKDQIS